MFKEEYKHLNRYRCPDEQLIQATIDAAHKQEEISRRIRMLARKPVVMIASVIVCLLLAMPILAATVEPVYQMMYLLSPEAAQFFMPVQKADECDGIKMEVVSAYVHENTIEIYITMQDVTGNRIDDTIDLYDNYAINRPFDSAASCELLGYEPDTKTASFLVTIQEYGHKNIIGNKVTFSVKKFISHKNIKKDLSIPLDLATVTSAEHTQILKTTNGGGDHGNGKLEKFEENPLALTPMEPMEEFPVEGIDLTGIGYVNQELQVELAVKDPLANGNQGFVYLKDPDGKVVSCEYQFNFSNEYENQIGRIDYFNYVFAIPEEQIGDYKIYGDFETSGMQTEGNWSITFPIQDAVK